MSKKHVPSDANKSIAVMASALGISHEIMAQEMGIDAKTLRLHYAAELRDGAERANLRVGANLFAIATSFEHPKGASSAMFWLKCRAGWSEFAAAPSRNPEVAAEKPAKLGKKEQLEKDAQTPPPAADGVEDWGRVLNKSRPAGPREVN